eukprot:scaffold2771_cov252-Pinguiococcus_pyrenoidosus.AAC.18
MFLATSSTLMLIPSAAGTPTEQVCHWHALCWILTQIVFPSLEARTDCVADLIRAQLLQIHFLVAVRESTPFEFANENQREAVLEGTDVVSVEQAVRLSRKKHVVETLSGVKAKHSMSYKNRSQEGRSSYGTKKPEKSAKGRTSGLATALAVAMSPVSPAAKRPAKRINQLNSQSIASPVSCRSLAGDGQPTDVVHRPRQQEGVEDEREQVLSLPSEPEEQVHRQELHDDTECHEKLTQELTQDPRLELPRLDQPLPIWRTQRRMRACNSDRFDTPAETEPLPSKICKTGLETALSRRADLQYLEELEVGDAQKERISRHDHQAKEDARLHGVNVLLRRAFRE